MVDAGKPWGLFGERFPDCAAGGNKTALALDSLQALDTPFCFEKPGKFLRIWVKDGEGLYVNGHIGEGW